MRHIHGIQVKIGRDVDDESGKRRPHVRYRSPKLRRKRVRVHSDFVVIRQQGHADDGDIVVALIDDQEATLKYLRYCNDGKIELRPANAALQSMTYASERIRIQGILISQLRTYR